MEVTIIDNGSLLVKLGPTEKRLLDEIAFASGNPPEKTFATIAFGAIVTENLEIKAQKQINEHSAYWDR